MNRVQGKRVLVTGASSGIGAACARRFAEAGSHLILIARRIDRLRALKEEIEQAHGVDVHTHAVDVRDRVAVRSAAAEIEERGLDVDVLINNAGLASGLSKLHEGDDEDWDKMIDTNVKGVLNVSRSVIPMMVARNSGHVVNIGSIAGHLVYPGGNVYNASKFAVRAINEGMNLDLAGTAIRVSSVDPGLTDTEFSVVRFHGDEEKAKAVYEGFDPLTADDIADAVFYVVNTPPHVNVTTMIILPTAQRSPYVLHREEKK